MIKILLLLFIIIVFTIPLFSSAHLSHTHSLVLKSGIIPRAGALPHSPPEQASSSPSFRWWEERPTGCRVLPRVIGQAFDFRSNQRSLSHASSIAAWSSVISALIPLAGCLQPVYNSLLPGSSFNDWSHPSPKPEPWEVPQPPIGHSGYTDCIS